MVTVVGYCVLTLIKGYTPMRFIKHNAKKWYYIGFATTLALVPALTTLADGGSSSE